MSTMRRSILAFSFCLALAPAAQAGQLLVIGSTDPAIPPGAVLDSDAPVSIADGAELRLLYEDGTPLALKGPYSGAIPEPVVEEGASEAEGPLLVEALAGMVGEGKVDSSEFGAVRAISEGKQSSDPWSVDLTRPGVACVQPGGRPTVWNAAAEQGMLRMLDGKGEAKLAFAGEGAAPWPADLPIVDGAGYAFVTPAGSPVLMTIKRAPAAMPTLAHVVRWLNDNGCVHQARMLLRDMPMPDPSRKLSVALGTPEGPAPKYRIGETLTVEIALNENAYVRCFYRQADGATVQLFPNRFNPSPRLAGPFVHTLPQAQGPFSIKLGGPAGKESIRCFGWRNDPTASLPTDVRLADVTEPLKRPFEEIAKEILASANPPAADALLEVEVVN